MIILIRTTSPAKGATHSKTKRINNLGRTQKIINNLKKNSRLNTELSCRILLCQVAVLLGPWLGRSNNRSPPLTIRDISGFGNSQTLPTHPFCRQFPWGRWLSRIPVPGFPHHIGVKSPGLGSTAEKPRLCSTRTAAPRAQLTRYKERTDGYRKTQLLLATRGIPKKRLNAVRRRDAYFGLKAMSGDAPRGGA